MVSGSAAKAVTPRWIPTSRMKILRIMRGIATPNDPKLSDRGARRGLCAGEGGEGAKAVGSIGRDVRSGSLQRMVRRFGS